MNPHLDPGLIMLTVLTMLAIVGLVLYLYLAGHLDEIDPEERKRIRAAILEWRGHPSTMVHRSDGTVHPVTPDRHRREVRSARQRPNPSSDF